MKRTILPFSNRDIQITDPLLQHYVDMIAGQVIPYQWDILNDRVAEAPPSHCLDNFRIAAGLLEGSHYGMVFQDSDVYKWLEAVAFSIENGSGAAFEETADQVIDLLAAAQQPDGYLNTYYTCHRECRRFSNLAEGHELYCAGHLFEAADAYYHATGKRKILDVACRFADLICQEFGPQEGQNHGVPGHQEVELALVKLYRITENQAYLKTARYFIDQRGKNPEFLSENLKENTLYRIFPELADYSPEYSQSHKPPVEQRDVEGHAVRAMYMCAAMADLALEQADDQLADAAKALFRSATEKRMFLTGSLGSSGLWERFTTDYDLPNDCNYSETCASAGLMMFGQRMNALTGEASYYDAVELALHNTLLSGISADGKRYFYVNPLEVHPSHCMKNTSRAHVMPVRQPWFDVACCPTNIARTLASIGQYIYARDGETVYINQPISSRLSTDGGKKVVQEASPDGHIRVITENILRLCIRIPWYAVNPSVRVNGQDAALDIRKGYAWFDLPAKALVELELHIKPVWLAANDAVSADRGRLALSYGPYVYCLEEADNGSDLSGLGVTLGTPVALGLPADGLPGNLPTLRYEAQRLYSGVSGLYGIPSFHEKKVPVCAIPYCLWCNRKPGEMLVWQRLRMG